MTMSGPQHLHKLQNGKRILKISILFCVLCLTLLGCAAQVASFVPGPGRNEWEVQLSDQYSIVKENNRSIKVCTVTDSTGVYEYVLSNFYATKYHVTEAFIAIEGIPTEDIFASDRELLSDDYQYYLIEVHNGCIYGPYDSESLLKESAIFDDIDVNLVWEKLPQ